MRHDNYKKDKSKTVIISLIVIVLILLAILAWAFAIKPTVNKYIQEKQTDAYIQGQNVIMQQILTQVEQYGSVQIPISESESIILDLRIPEKTI